MFLCVYVCARIYQGLGLTASKQAWLVVTERGLFVTALFSLSGHCSSSSSEGREISFAGLLLICSCDLQQCEMSNDDERL